MISICYGLRVKELNSLTIGLLLWNRTDMILIIIIIINNQPTDKVQRPVG